MNTTQKSLLVISSYPEKSEIHGKKVVGIASYTKNTLLALKKYSPELAITVLAEKFGKKSESYDDQEILVKRTWRRGTFSIFPDLIRQSVKTPSKDVLVEFELAMFGGMHHAALFPFFLLWLKLSRKNTTLVLHQVVADINEMSGHLNLAKHSFKADTLNTGLKIYYFLLMLTSNRVIVFEEVLAKRLAKYGPKDKIKVIPHAVETFTTTAKASALQKKLSGKFTLLYFGYLAWYKGADLLIQMFENRLSQTKKFFLVMAGGANPNHQHKDYYKNYIESLSRKNNDETIMVTGFIAEKDIPTYFSNADVVVLPYRTLMSASGPLSIALSYEKPILLSNQLAELANTSDFQTALTQNGLTIADIIFTNEESFAEKIEKLSQDKVFRSNVTLFSKNLATNRAWPNIAKQYYAQIFS
jgi:glycosyltransferase involved in cell wall biosynthesis